MTEHDLLAVFVFGFFALIVWLFAGAMLLAMIGADIARIAGPRPKPPNPFHPSP